MKQIIFALIVLLIIAGGVFYFMRDTGEVPTTPEVDSETDTTVTAPEDTDDIDDIDEVTEIERGPTSVIGTSADGNAITAYHFGDGDTELLFVGGIHGGYSWNTAMLGYELVDYLEENPDVIPDNVTATVIPVLNPDGLEATVGTTGRFNASAVPASEATRIAGRFNGNEVDINRNFACKWQADATWQNRTVSGGTSAFSEPESQAIRSYVEDYDPEAVVVWYSAAGGVYASNCENGVLPETTTLTNLFADASGYPAYEEFDYYEITGDMVNWLALNRIPAISVLLTNHTSTEWAKNEAGVRAVLEHYAE